MQAQKANSNVASAAPFVSPAPAYEWRGSSQADELIDFDDVGQQELTQQIFELEMCYHRGEFEKAYAMANEVIETSRDAACTMSAMATRVLAATAMGDADAAYLHLNDFVYECNRALRAQGGPTLHGVSFMCAKRVESVLMMRLFDLPPLDRSMESLPDGLKALIECTMVLRELINGNSAKADGIICAVRGFVGERYPISRLFLVLLDAATQLMEGRLDKAEHAFLYAWDLAHETGAITPFVELDLFLCGLERRCSINQADELYRRLTSSAGTYAKGWFALRKKCGIGAAGETLTPNEWYAMRLAGIGWRNKEIAAHLIFSENTIKHMLTSSYQKTGISRRADIPKMLDDLFAVPRNKVQNGKSPNDISAD